jgi:pimeloyl-ACP methyl ester carboxylesterase
LAAGDGPAAAASHDGSQRITLRMSPDTLMGDVSVRDLEVNHPLVERPAIIVLAGGSEGGFWTGGRLMMPLAWSGYSIRFMAYVGAEGAPSRLVERDLEPIAAALGQARQTNGHARRCVGLIGVSKGGELAMLLAAYGDALSEGDGPLVDAVVAAAPSHVVWQTPDITLSVRSSWAMNGEPLEFVRHPWLSPFLFDVLFDFPNVSRYLGHALQSAPDDSAAAIPVERISIPTLMVAGDDDPVWPAQEMTQAALARADRLNPDHALELSVYGGDHFILSDDAVMRDVITFLDRHLRAAAAAGQCEADFVPLHTGSSQ